MRRRACGRCSETADVVPGRDQDHPAVSTSTLACRHRPEDPERRWEVGSNGVALLRGPEVVLSLGKEGPTDPRGSSGGSGEAEDRDGEQASRAVSRTSRPAGHHDSGGEVQAWDDWRRSKLVVRAGDLYRLASIRVAITHSRVVRSGGCHTHRLPSRPRYQEQRRRNPAPSLPRHPGPAVLAGNKVQAEIALP